MGVSGQAGAHILDGLGAIDVDIVISASVRVRNMHIYALPS